MPAPTNDQQMDASAASREARKARDRALVDAVLRGDSAAFSSIYTLYEPTISRRVRRIVVRLDEVEDVVQKVFIEAHRCLARFDRERSLEAWLNGLAMRWTANHLRSVRRRRWLSFSEPQKLEAVDLDSLPSPEATVRDRELLERFYEAMQKLPIAKRQAFALVVLDGMELKEAGEILGVAAKTVWARVESARGALRKHLAPRGSARRDAGPEPSHG